MSEPIPTRRLGSSGINLSVLGLGTWGLCAESYGRVYQEQRERTVARAVDQGVRVVDMAPWWGPEGASEKLVRAAVDTGRDAMTYITRAGLSHSRAGVTAAFDAAALTAQCEGSLSRLGTCRIDVWLLHEPTESDLCLDALHACLATLKQAGKIRAWGVATSQDGVARTALDKGAEVLCLPFNLHRPQLVWDLGPGAAARGVGILARSILLHGLLAGRWNPKKCFARDDHRTQRWNADALGERVRQTGDLRFLVHGATLSMASAAQRFVLAHDAVTCALIGPRTPGQVEAAVNALAFDQTMPADDLDRVRRISR